MAVVKCPSCGAPVDVPEPTVPPKKSSGMAWGIGCLIAVLVGFVAVPVVGVLATIAIPSFVKIREVAQASHCVNNMRMIADAKNSAALANDRLPGDSITEQELAYFMEGGVRALACPKGGGYVVNPIGQDPECSVHGTLSRVRETGRHP